MTWKYAYEDCVRPHGIYDQFTHDTVPVEPDAEIPGDRLELMWCSACKAYLWGVLTIHEEPW